jgi:hypothetical protein
MTSLIGRKLADIAWHGTLSRFGSDEEVTELAGRHPPTANGRTKNTIVVRDKRPIEEFC